MRIQFAWGATRFVILVGAVAIKVARPRPFRALRRLIKYQISGEVRARLLTFAEDPFLAGFSSIFSGILANRNEYRLWQETPRHFLVPTLYSFCWLINVQRRGESVSQEELRVGHPFRVLLEGRSPGFVGDMTKTANFCRYEGRVCLLDYGSYDVLTFFSRPQSHDVTLADVARD